MTRKLSDWVGAFEDATEGSGSPLRLRRWAAIAAVAGVLERKVWVHTAGADFYPNLYVMLVAPPGVGKSKILSTVRSLWATVPDHKIAAPSVSKASLIDELHDSLRTIIRVGKNPPTYEFHSLKVLASELGVFLPEFANDFMNTLTDIYDGYPYSERKRTKNLKIDIEKPQINLLTATTPSYLTALLPEGAWDQGFLSRSMLVYSGERKLVSLFAASKVDSTIIHKLKEDLHEIADLFGEIKFTPEAAAFIDEWYLGGQHPVPNHPKLQHYLTRRAGHLLKLSQIACVNEGNKLVIEVHHIQRALDWLVDMEISIPEIFKAMASGGDAKVMDECWHMLFQFKAKFKKGAPQSVIYRFLSERTPSHNVARLLDLMEKTNMIRVEAVKGEGMLYEAKERGVYQ